MNEKTTSNSELLILIQQLDARITELEKSKKSRKKAPPSEGPTPVSQVRDAFLMAWERRMGAAYPGWGARENGLASNLLKSIPLSNALMLCTAYPRWPDRWCADQGYPFELLVKKRVALSGWVVSPQAMIDSRAAARTAEGMISQQVQRRGVEQHGELQRRGVQAERDRLSELARPEATNQLSENSGSDSNRIPEIPDQTKG